MHRFFVDGKLINKNNITIEGDDVQHISKVLRLRPKEQIEVCDGEGYDYICSIESINKKSVVCSIISKEENKSEPSIKVDLYQGIPKAGKMDIIVQKCTELGINAIIPVDTERAVVKAHDDRGFENKIDRWQRIALEASKQSKRGRVPIVEKPITFDEAVKRLNDYDVVFMPYENEKCKGLKSILEGQNNVRRVAIIIGPEGGFTEEEVNKAQERGAHTVTLGPRILRTETAGFVCLTIIMYGQGDMGGRV